MTCTAALTVGEARTTEPAAPPPPAPTVPLGVVMPTFSNATTAADTFCPSPPLAEMEGWISRPEPSMLPVTR